MKNAFLDTIQACVNALLGWGFEVQKRQSNFFLSSEWFDSIVLSNGFHLWSYSVSNFSTMDGWKHKNCSKNITHKKCTVETFYPQA